MRTYLRTTFSPLFLAPGAKWWSTSEDTRLVLLVSAAAAALNGSNLGASEASCACLEYRVHVA